MLGECGLSAVGETDMAIISDNVPKEGYFIMYRTTTSEKGQIKYLWQRAKILQIAKPSQENSDLKAAILRMNPSTTQAFTQDVTLGPSNCGDGSEEGKIWLRIVDKAIFASKKQQ
jgi:hypothetical protein